MIIREFYLTREDGTNLYRTYSDKDLKILQTDTNAVYDEAIDVENASHQYEETNISIYADEKDIPAEEALNIILGVNENEQTPS